MSTKLHEGDWVEEASFEMRRLNIRKGCPENRWESSEDWRGDEFDSDKRRGRETGDDRLNFSQAARAADVQKPGVCEEDVRASGECSKEGG